MHFSNTSLVTYHYLVIHYCLLFTTLYVQVHPMLPEESAHLEVLSVKLTPPPSRGSPALLIVSTANNRCYLWKIQPPPTSSNKEVLFLFPLPDHHLEGRVLQVAKGGREGEVLLVNIHIFSCIVLELY